MENSVEKKLESAFAALRRLTAFKPDVAIVLGSGLGGFADEMEIETAVSYSGLPGMPVSTVEGHRGRFVFGKINGVRAAVMQGRVHYYEGYPMDEVVGFVRLMKMAGAGALCLTNAVGGISPDLRPGDFMLIKDHISLFAPSPLRGPNIDSLGPRFPDMSSVYDPEFISVAVRAAQIEGIELKSGVLVQTPGPQFETPSEIRMLRALGADAVGMSTVCEAVAARHCGLRVCGISCVSNMAAGISGTPLSMAEVSETAARVAPLFWRLLKRVAVGLGGLAAAQ